MNIHLGKPQIIFRKKSNVAPVVYSSKSANGGFNFKILMRFGPTPRMRETRRLSVDI
jgi:hypothetical protein